MKRLHLWPRRRHPTRAPDDEHGDVDNAAGVVDDDCFGANVGVDADVYEDGVHDGGDAESTVDAGTVDVDADDIY
eukprot:73207-Pyramimonas_sp.AAC.1